MRNAGAVIKAKMKKAKNSLLYIAPAGAFIAILSVLITGALNVKDAQIVKPRYAYVRADWLSKIEEYGEEKLSINRNEIYQIATSTTLPHSYVKMLLLENTSGVTAEEVTIKCIIYRHPVYQKTGYASQNMVLEKDSIVGEKCEDVHYTVLRKEDGIVAIPCKITTGILDNAVESLIDADAIIAEIDFDGSISYYSASRKNLPWYIQFLKPNTAFTEKVPSEMNNPKIYCIIEED